MGKNKPARNAFYFFMLDFKDKNPRKFPGLKEVAEAANPHWQKLTPEQRKPYEEKAKGDKHQQKVVKYTTTGVSIAVMQKREDEHLAKVQAMKDDITNIIHGAIESGRIAEHPFYLIHLNHYGFCNTNRQYIPAEIAVARFTLQEGVVTPENVYHSIIKPGPLPIGYAFQAMKASSETHLIEPKLGDDAESNLDQVTGDLMSFMTEFNNHADSTPPVYVRENNRDAVENVLKSFCLNSGYEENFIKVYSLEYFFFVLRNAVGDQLQPAYPSVAVGKMELEKDKYDFCKNIPCNYHTASDVPYHCSRSNAIRTAYIICDNCCADLGIDLIAGQHVPVDSKIVSTRPQSVASGYSTSSKLATVKEAAHDKKLSRNNPNADDYFLSQRTESGISAMSETSSVFDPNEYAVLGGYAYDSEYSQADTEEWIEPRHKHKRNQNRASSQTSANSTATPPALQFASSSGADYNPPTVNRRPATMSAALVGGLSQLSLSPSPGSCTTRNILPVGRGRGRGIAASFANKK